MKDKILENALGTDPDLDNAIEYYLEDDSEEEEYDEGYDDDDY